VTGTTATNIFFIYQNKGCTLKGARIDQLTCTLPLLFFFYNSYKTQRIKAKFGKLNYYTMTRHWEPSHFDHGQLPALQEATKLDPVFCKLLLQRGLNKAEAANQFFHPKLKELHDPFLMKDMYVAVGRINKAIANQEPILIYGDYDVDGVCSVAMFFSFLEEYHHTLLYYIPDRYREGYGISMEGIHFANENEVKLIITIDCGIRAVDQIAMANTLGMDVIVCDHHLTGPVIPDALAILNPQQADCNYPFPSLCGCGVAFKLAQALCMANEWPAENYLQLLDFVAIATACDIVPVLDENRVLVYWGLEQIKNTKREGLLALLTLSQRGDPLSVSDLVFGIGPMINAAGRLGDAKESVLLLLTKDDEEANNQAAWLHQQNENRKAIDQQTVKEAILLLENEDNSDKIIVLFQSNWHKGIVGIVASRLVDRYQKPTIVLAESAGLAVGSARSISGFDVNALIGKCDHLLTTYGGHKYAAGLTLPLENVAPFKEEIEKILATEEMPTPSIKYALELPLEKIDFDLYEQLQQFAPFGPGNRNPVFVSKSVSLYSTPRLLKKSHLQFSINIPSNNSIKCIAFNQADSLMILQEESPFDICYNLMENNWNGIRSLQLNIKGIRRQAE
jgi:single-stranded-DNA-specific exonuclease